MPQAGHSSQLAQSPAPDGAPPPPPPGFCSRPAGVDLASIVPSPHSQGSVSWRGGRRERQECVRGGLSSFPWVCPKLWFGSRPTERPEPRHRSSRTQPPRCRLHPELRGGRDDALSGQRAISVRRFGRVAHSFASHTNAIASFQYCFPFPIPDFRLLRADCSRRGHLLLLEYKPR